MLSAQRQIRTSDKGYIEPSDGLDDLVKHMDEQKPIYSCLYFTAKWNPMCAKIESSYERICKEYPNFNHIRIDCD